MEEKSAHKLIKLQEMVVKEEEVDRISVLPDHLLLEILSRLPFTKDAIKTGTLAKRWEHIWTLIPFLTFKHDRDNQPLSEFVSLVDKTLTQCHQLKLKSFLLGSKYDAQFEPQFNNWIRYAISCNVEELGLCMKPKAQLFDQNFFTTSCFTRLGLCGCLLNPTGAISWKNLRSLRVSNGNLDEDLIENILSGSPVLETLVLQYCKGYRRLNITSKSVKNLVLSGYMDTKANNDDGNLTNFIEIKAPNILLLTIVDNLELRKLLLLNVSSLVEANLDYALVNNSKPTPDEVIEESLKGNILKLRHIRELKIGSSCSKVLSRLEAQGFAFPSNLKSMDAAFDWSNRFGFKQRLVML